MHQFGKILIVDDQVENLRIMAGFLRSSVNHYDLLEVSSGIRALKIAHEAKPDLIITDWDMPQMNGIELIMALKSDPATRGIPVIMATGVMLTSDNLMLALDAGAVDYIRKPIDRLEFQARISSALTVAAHHKKVLDDKNRQLTEYALMMVKNHEFVQLLHEQLWRLLNADFDGRESFVRIKLVTRLLDEHLRTGSFEKFEVAFSELHPLFYKNLLARFPSLTAGEMKLCAFIRLGLNIKDVATLLCVTPEGVKVSRSRLRKKLYLKPSENIESFLMGV
ncbi:MAG: response regulator [Breznakibacter sp.]